MPMTIADLPIRAKIKFGAYSVNGETPHKICWLKAHRDNTLLTEFLEDQCAFDGKEPGNSDEYRRSYGNNRFLVSNINQFLNATGRDWYECQHPEDTPPVDIHMYNNSNGYAHKPGFLNRFEEWEIEVIESTEIITAKPLCDTEDKEVEFDRHFTNVFIPSITNLKGVANHGIYEGEKWDMFIDGKYACRLSPECHDFGTCRDKPHREDGDWYYNLRSPHIEEGHEIFYVDRGGDISYYYAGDEIMGLRPALKLNHEVLVSDEPDEEGYYKVIGTLQEVVEIEDQDYFEILMKN